ncbi:hypothetical protein [Candidatus Methylomirabilis sp.]
MRNILIRESDFIQAAMLLVASQFFPAVPVPSRKETGVVSR